MWKTPSDLYECLFLWPALERRTTHPLLSALHCEFISLVMLNQQDMQSTNLIWDKLLWPQSHMRDEGAQSYSMSASKCLRLWGRWWEKVRGLYWSLADQWLTLTVAIASECLISLLCGNAVNSFVTPSSSKIPSPSSFLWHLTQRKLKLAIFHFVSKEKSHSLETFSPVSQHVLVFVCLPDVALYFFHPYGDATPKWPQDFEHWGNEAGMLLSGEKVI